MVKVAPLFVHEPELLYDTARPELEVAATVNCELKAALAGACVSTVIVWFALLTFSVKLASVIAPQLSVARIVIVCEPTGAALLIDTTPVVLLTLIVPVYVPTD